MTRAAPFAGGAGRAQGATRPPGAFGIMLLAVALCPVGCGDRPASDAPARHTYAARAFTRGCEPGARPGRAAITDGERAPGGGVFNVRTPSNYDSTVAHPLLVVYSPAGGTALGSERATRLTGMATAAGFVVAYVDARRLSIPEVRDLGAVPGLVARKWCIDEQRVVLTGHSDGGTVSLALAILDETTRVPAGIAPSAAGFSGADLARYRCPAPLAVMVMHSAKDTHFPGFGAQSARWWATCNGCDPSRTTELANGCRLYAGCARQGPTMYCEGTRPHAVWPGRNQEILEFFVAVLDSTAGRSGLGPGSAPRRRANR